jgi:hypothetical protein
MSIKTQGTHLYVSDTITSSVATLVKIDCPTGLQGLGGARDQIETTCLDVTDDKRFVAGLGNPGQVTVPFNLDPQSASHQSLFAWKEAGTVMHWMAALSEAATDPTLDTDDTIIPPTDRTSLAFDAYVADVAIDIATNDIVKGTLTLQRSGPVVFTPATV